MPEPSSACCFKCHIEFQRLSLLKGHVYKCYHINSKKYRSWRSIYEYMVLRKIIEEAKIQALHDGILVSAQ